MEKRSNWEDHAVASFCMLNYPTKMSPYEVLFVQNPPLLQLPSSPTPTFPDPGDYSSQTSMETCSVGCMRWSKQIWWNYRRTTAPRTEVYN